MRLTALAAPLAALALIVGARQLGASANQQRAHWPKDVDEPYAPSATAAPLVSLGYREALADWLYVRALAYFGGDDGATSPGVQHLIGAIAALDPGFEEPMSWGALAMWSATMEVSQDDYRNILALLEAAGERFPKNYKLAQRAGEIYVMRMHSDDAAELRAFKVKGTQLLSKAVHLPGAPRSLGTYVAHLETELGQRDKAIRDLRELVLYTSDANARAKLVAKLAKLTQVSSETLAYELDVERVRFETQWHAQRPELSAAMFAVIGPPITDWFDPADLSAPDLEFAEPIEPLPPLADDVGELPLAPAP